MARARVGRYTLDGVIGVGSFATVHRADDERLEDTVVLKVLAENHSLNPEIRERFIAEGRSLRRIDSPHVVTVHDLGESERQQPYLVLEYADRGTLADRVEGLRRRGWTASREDVLVTARSLAAALDAVHAARLVHRDLSPANVLLRSVAASTEPQESSSAVVHDDERLLVADLGLCKDLARNSGLTVAGGTSGFRPPEMAAGPAVIDARADLWSLSAVLSWLCEGSDLPPALTDAWRRSLADDPADRHADVAAWLADVEAALAPPEPEPEADPSETTATAPAPVSSPWRRAAALVAVLLVGVLAGGLLIRATDDAPASTDTARISVEGPTDLLVGEPATFTARTEGVRHYVWELPTGRFVADQPTVTLTPRGAGSATVTLRAQDATGHDLRVVHEIEVAH